MQPFGSTQNKSYEDTALYPSPTTIGRDGESGAVCVCANAAFAIYYSQCAQSVPSPARMHTHTQHDPTAAREAKEVMLTNQPDRLS